MANPEHLERLRRGVEPWNEWRRANRDIKPDLRAVDLSNADLSNIDLSESDLSGAYLSGVNLSLATLSGDRERSRDRGHVWSGAALFTGANLSGANLHRADMRGVGMFGANLSNADFTGAELAGFSDRDGRFGVVLSNANLSHAHLSGVNMGSAELENADLSGADLSHAYLYDAVLNNANLTGANLDGADLTAADLRFAQLEEANFSNATLSRCQIYGVSAWNVRLENAVQKGLIISKNGYGIHVDDLEVAQFVHLIMNNKKLRNVIDAVTSKAVLILGRFKDEQRKAVLDGLREKLRQFDLLPIVFDFDVPSDKDYTETVQTLAGMSMFVIADLTSPKSTPLELEATVKHFKIPYIPILDVSVDPRPFAMLVDLQKSFHWVLPLVQYEAKEDLLDDQNLKNYLLDPAMRKREELRMAKTDLPEPVMIRKRSPLECH